MGREVNKGGGGKSMFIVQGHLLSSSHIAWAAMCCGLHPIGENQQSSEFKQSSWVTVSEQ